nr:hypothetical protein [Tanacetum cinerariifolium]
MKLYKANLRLSQAFHPLLGIIEVVLRNQLNNVLSAHFTDPQWIINQKAHFMSHPSLTYTYKKTGQVRTNKFLKGEVERAEKRLRKAGATITSGRIIAEQTFGFWTDLFEVHHYRLLRGKPIQAFSFLPPGYGRREVLDELHSIRRFRNRINHNEPICFSQSTIDLSYAQDVHQSITNILSWIEPQAAKFTADLDKVNRAILMAQ